MDVKELVKKYKDINKQVLEDKNQIEIDQHFIRIAQLKNRTDSQTEELVEEMETLSKRIEKNKAKLKNKAKYFNTSLRSLLNKVRKILEEKYPDKKITILIKTLKNDVVCVEGFYGNIYYYNKLFEYGFEIGHGKKVSFQFEVEADDTDEDALDLYVSGHSINMLDCGLLNNQEDFADDEWQELFWEIFEKNVSTALKKLEEKYQSDKEKLENDYNKKQDDLLN